MLHNSCGLLEIHPQLRKMILKNPISCAYGAISDAVVIFFKLLFSWPFFMGLAELQPQCLCLCKRERTLFGVAAPFFALAHLAVLPQSHLDFFFFSCIILVLAGRRKHLVPQAQWESTRRCPRTAELSTEMAKPSGTLVALRDFNFMFGKKVAHGLGFSHAFAVQGINVGWLHPQKLP